MFDQDKGQKSAISGRHLHWIFFSIFSSGFYFRGALKGTNLRGQTEPKRRFSLIFADSRLFLENKAFGKCRFSQKTADFRREPQKTAGTRRKPQIGVCPLRFVPLSAAPYFHFSPGLSVQFSNEIAPNLNVEKIALFSGWRKKRRVLPRLWLQESPRQTKPKKGPKRKVHEFRPFL